MLDAYSAVFPPLLHFGSGVRRKTPEILDALMDTPRAFLVSSRTVRNTALGTELADAIGTRLVGEQQGVPHDPPIAAVDAIIEQARACNANCFVALGGGSVMDATKTAALLYYGNSGVADYFRGQIPHPKQWAPVIALPTTSGTGAEITKNAVLTDEERDVKASIRSPNMVPKAALVDPDFTLGLPRRVTADSGLDALTQAIESYVSTGASRLTRALAAEAVAILLQWLPKAWDNGMDLEARTRCAEGSMLTALAFSQSGLGAVHGLAHPIGHRLNLAHGYVCATLLPDVIAANIQAVPQEFRALAQLCGLKDEQELLQTVQRLCRQMDVPERIPNLDSDTLSYIIANCRSGSMKANPRFLSDQELVALLTGK